MWDVTYYQKANGEIPVKEYLLNVSEKLRAKVLHEIDLLSEHGFYLREPYVSPIKGKRYKGLYELRTKFATDISRVIYFAYDGKTFVLLHGLNKKSQKTPKLDLERALSYMEDYIRGN